MGMILEINENTFNRRYGLSLEEMWKALSADEQNDALSIYDCLRETKPENSLGFENEHMLRIVIGYGGKKYLEKICENTGNLVRMIIWEPENKIFLAGCIREDIHEYIGDERLTICLGRDQKDLRNCLMKNVLVTNAFHSKMMAIGDYTVSGSIDVASFSSCYISVVEEVLGESNSMKHFSHLSCENWLNAISILNNNFLTGQLFEQIDTRDIPIIIVAAGPSLKKNCKALEKAKGKALIVSATHAMGTLFSNDIKPDLVAVTDAAPFDFAGCDKEKECSLLSSVYAARNDQNLYNGKVFFWGFRATAGQFKTDRMARYPENSTGTGSVATDVFSMFVNAGFKNLILVGQDLAYDDDGYSHSDGKKESTEIVYETEGVFNNIVRTRSDWVFMKKMYESIIGDHPDIQVIDATEGGAKINGSVIMPLSKAIEQWCDKVYQIDQWMMQVKSGDQNELEYINNWFDECINECITFTRQLDRIIKQNRAITAGWRNKWDDSFRALCKQYDVMYNIIMNGDGGFVLKHYCIKEIQEYIENALVLEGDENIEKRMELEYELFSLMRSTGDKLISYITDLRR